MQETLYWVGVSALSVMGLFILFVQWMIWIQPQINRWKFLRENNVRYVTSDEFDRCLRIVAVCNSVDDDSYHSYYANCTTRRGRRFNEETDANSLWVTIRHQHFDGVYLIEVDGPFSLTPRNPTRVLTRRQYKKLQKAMDERSTELASNKIMDTIKEAT